MRSRGFKLVPHFEATAKNIASLNGCSRVAAMMFSQMLANVHRGRCIYTVSEDFDVVEYIFISRNLI